MPNRRNDDDDDDDDDDSVRIGASMRNVRPSANFRQHLSRELGCDSRWNGARGSVYCELNIIPLYRGGLLRLRFARRDLKKNRGGLWEPVEYCAVEMKLRKAAGN